MTATNTGLTLTGVLERLSVPPEGILYVQASMDWLKTISGGPIDVIDALRRWAGAGTLVMPAYPSRVTHAEYLAQRPTYDVRRTPVGVGVIPELFRRMPGVLRSLEPDYPVAALGPDAAMIVGDLPGDDPFGADSPYRRMLNAGGTLLGLGVSLNTNSFVHVFDSILQNQYSVPVYAQERVSVPVTIHTGKVFNVPRRVLRPEFQRLTKPSKIAGLIGEGETFASFMDGPVQFFRWNLQQLESSALQHGRTRLAEGRWPCWLEGMQ